MDSACARLAAFFFFFDNLQPIVYQMHPESSAPHFLRLKYFYLANTMCMMANKQINFKKQNSCGNKVYNFPHRLDTDFPNEMKHLHIILPLYSR